MGWSNDQFTGELVIPTGATTGARIEINVNNSGKIQLYNSADLLVAEVTPAAGSNDDPGFIAYSKFATNSYVFMGDSGIEFGDTDVSFQQYPGISLSGAEDGSDPVSLIVLGGKITGTSVSSRIIMQSAPSPATRTTMLIDAFNGVTDVDISGDLTAANLDAGVESVTTVATQWVEETVLFNGTFTAAPVVVVTGNSDAPAAGGTTELEYAVTGITTTQFTLRVRRSTGITMDIGWLAYYKP